MPKPGAGPDGSVLSIWGKEKRELALAHLAGFDIRTGRNYVRRGPRMRARLGLAGLAFLTAMPGWGQTLNTYGNVGLIDVPSAEAAPDGTISFSCSLLNLTSTPS